MPELDPSYQGLLFLDLNLEDLDLESIMGDKVSLEMKVMILMANGDFIVYHHLEINQATATAAQGAFLPVSERDLFQLELQPTVMPELNPS